MAETESQKEELGYLYLEECDVHLSSSLNVSCSSSLKVGEWIDLKFLKASSSSSSSSSVLGENGVGEEEHCRECTFSIIFQHGQQQPCTLETREFDGTITDRNRTCPHCKKSVRDDATLLLGLARACGSFQHVEIQRVQIFFPVDTSWKKCRLSISLHIPEVSKGRYLTSSNKMLPPCTQLLLSILRSDWNFLCSSDDKVKSKRKKSPCYFPTKLSLQEIYHRIGGAADNDDSCLSDHEQYDHPDCVSLLTLPKEILQHHIAIFLRAKSLDSWRCTCRYMFTAIGNCVPGLNLQLYHHQIKSLRWMRRRETKLLLEGDLFLSSRGNDAHRAASGGASVCLVSRINTKSTTRERTHICQSTGQVIQQPKDDPLSRKMARGGLLCDDPGLGKTITVISLILQTLGLSTASLTAASISTGGDATNLSPKDVLAPNQVVVDDSVNNKTTESNADEQIFCEYWKTSLLGDFQCQYLNQLLNALQKECRDAEDYFLFPVDTTVVTDYLQVISEPICLQNIRSFIKEQKYTESFDLFEQDVGKIFSNAVLYNAPDTIIHKAAVDAQNIISTLIENFKTDKIKVAKKAFRRASFQPNSTLAALVAQTSKQKLLDSLVASCSTLLVVPSVLLEHWQDQLRLHVNQKYVCSPDKTPVVFEYTGTASCAHGMESIVNQCKVLKTHHPFIFVDKSSTRKLPSAYFLAMFDIVITTNQRFTNEWKNGSFQDELNRRTSDYRFYQEKDNEDSACPLLKVNWLRMIVDEGHSMSKGRDNSAICFASWIVAQRRWAMTGTPTRQVLSASGIKNIWNLMQYLQHEFMDRKKDGDAVWQNLVNKSWNKGNLAAFYRLSKLLGILMVRHTKSDIVELPPPRYLTRILEMSEEEVTTYNTLVCAIQSNLLITSMEGETSGKQDSLLHRSQARLAKEALSNVRLVCAGGTQVLPTLSQKFGTEFIDDFQACNSNPIKLDSIKKYLHRAVTGQLSSCECCSIMLSTLLVFPCGCLVCTECVDHTTTQCIVCSKPFDVDLFQRLQPGMNYQWLHNVEEELKEKKNNPTATTTNLEEQPQQRQPVLEGGAGMLVPIDPTVTRRRTRKPGDGHICEYSPKLTTGECLLCWKVHDDCILLNSNKKCEVCHRRAEECPESETKSSYVVNKLVDLYQNHDSYQQQLLSSSLLERKKRPLKVIVFSQFRKVLNLTGDRLIRRFGSGCVAEYWGSFRKKELHKFIYSKDCFCMLLGNDGSEGLDLSFVTNIFFMEVIYDKSLEQQAVARAWRMGATGSVQVETLVAQTSVEEAMNQLEQEFSQQNSSKKEYQRAKFQYLLKGLSLISNIHAMSFGGVSNNELVNQIINGKDVNNELSKKRKEIDYDEKRPARRVRFV